MAKDWLQKEIVKKGGYILSDGTLNLEHLLPKAYDLLRKYAIKLPGDLYAEILHCFEFKDGYKFNKQKPGLFEAQYHGHAKLKQTSAFQDVASYLWNEDLYNFFNSIAPEGYYFGSSEGDGACIGWFKFEEEEDAV